MGIIEYRNHKDLYVRFETGDVVHTSYYEFQKGKTGCPSFRKMKRVGEKTVNSQGIGMEIIEYRDCNDVDVRFSTGHIVTGKRYGQFREGKISCPSEQHGKACREKTQ